MPSTAYEEQPPSGRPVLRRARWRPGDFLFEGVTRVAALAATGLVLLLAWTVFSRAWPAIEQFGIGFLADPVWDPIKGTFGARSFIVGTLESSFVALLLATPLSIAIALFLTEIAPRWIAGPVATLVELLAAIPSVVLGLWGILVLGPWVAQHLEPALERRLGFIPLFSGSPSQAGMLPAALVLTLMVVPITASVCRELLLRVPTELEHGALALGATRWETIRGVVLPFVAPGIVAAVLLGLGRAFGEAIAVTQVIGGGTRNELSLFAPADTLASRIASQYQGAETGLQVDSIMYLAAILLVISLVTNLVAQLVVRRFERTRGALA